MNSAELMAKLKSPDQDELLREIGRNVRYERKQRGLTQKKLAELADVSQSFVCKVEKGNTEGGIISMTKLGLALGLHLRPWWL